MNPDRRDFLVLGMGALAVATLPRALRRKAQLVRRQIPVMGTVAEIAVRHQNESWAQRAMDAAFAELRRVDETMSRFRDDSDVGRLNRASPGAAVAVSAHTAQVLRRSLRWAEVSEGRFDPCLGRAVELWDVGRRTAPPPGGEVQRLAAAGLHRTLEVERRVARLHSRQAAVDLGGIGKGFGVDLAGQALKDHGVFHALVNVGGDLVALGVGADGEPWRIGIRSPDHPDQIAETLTVSDRAVATSGDYLQYFRYSGRRYHHLLDPTSGEPRRTAMRSLTVEADRCVDADAAATALFGADDGTIRRVLEEMTSGARIAHSA
jgi:thiamine biosynthesis lipoprotein